MNNPTIIQGIGDDAALLRFPSDSDTVICMDTMVEGVHFTRRTMKPYHIGYKLLASNISDLAAMGGHPLYYLVSIAIPSHWMEEEILEIYKGMETLSRQFSMEVIGGDTVSSQHELIVTVTAIGQVNKNRKLLRSNAKAGDIVFVTGTLGDAACGLDLLLQYGVDHPFTEEEQYFVKRHQEPTPRVNIGAILANFPRVSLNDVSDGVASELNEIAEASNISIVLHSAQLPAHDKLAQFEKAHYYMLYGGEDYELIGTIAPEYWQELQNACHSENVPITKIGHVQEGPPAVYIEGNGNSELLKKKGYNHFNK